MSQDASQKFSLTQCKLFAGLSANELTEVSAFFYEANFKAGQQLLVEKETVTNLYIIQQGVVELSRKENNHDFPLETLADGEIVGDQALLPGVVSPVTVYAKENTQVFVANSNSLVNFLKTQPTLYNKILQNIGLHLSQELDISNQITVNVLKTNLDELNTRVKMGVFVIYVLSLLFVHNLFVDYLQYLYHTKHQTPTYITIVVLAVFAMALMIMIKQMGYSLSEFGFNLRNWRHALRESLWWSLLFIILITFIKWLFITSTIAFHGVPLFDFAAITRRPNFTFYTDGIWPWLIPALLYLLFVPVQVFINHGAFQESLLHFLKGKHTVLFSIILSDLLFTSIHADFNLRYALTVFIPGLLWATMYAKQRSLLGVGVSHALVGLWAIWMLGMDRIVGLVSVAAN